MAENSEERAVLRFSEWKRRTLTIVLALGLGCIFVGTVLVSLFFVWSSLSNSCTPRKTTDCSHSSNSFAGEICGAVSILFFLVGGFTIITWHKKKREHSSAEVVVSAIPAEDLEKSPTPLLPYNHIPHHPFVEASSRNLPDYFTAVYNTREVSSNLSEGFWTEDIDDSDLENPPPCYEQALKMSQLAAFANDVDKHLEHGNIEDTRL